MTAPGHADDILGVLHPLRTFRQRLLGVLAIGRLQDGVGVWLWDCRAVHTLGLRQALDVVFLDAHDQVLQVCHALPPNRIAWHRNAISVIELAPGFCSRHPDYARWIRQRTREVRRGLTG